MEKRQYIHAINLLAKGVEDEFPLVKAQNLDYYFKGVLTPEQMAGHLKAMIPKMRGFLDGDRLSKLNRWLGYAQGFANAAGIFSLNGLREMNIPPEETFIKK